MSEGKRYAYDTYKELKIIYEYHDHTVMAVCAPPNTKLVSMNFTHLSVISNNKRLLFPRFPILLEDTNAL